MNSINRKKHNTKIIQCVNIFNTNRQGSIKTIIYSSSIIMQKINKYYQGYRGQRKKNNKK